MRFSARLCGRRPQRSAPLVAAPASGVGAPRRPGPRAPAAHEHRRRPPLSKRRLGRLERLGAPRRAGARLRRVPNGGPGLRRPAGRTLGILVEPDGPLWRGSGGASRRRARNLWATAHMLWARGGLVPRPIACLTRDGELRLWLARDPASRTLLQSLRLSGSATRGDRAGRSTPRARETRPLAQHPQDRPREASRRRHERPAARSRCLPAARPVRRKRRERARELVMQRLTGSSATP